MRCAILPSRYVDPMLRLRDGRPATDFAVDLDRLEDILAEMRARGLSRVPIAEVDPDTDTPVPTGEWLDSTGALT